MRRRLFPVLALAVLAAAGWLYFTPHMAVRSVQRAAEAGDMAALDEVVDFPALRTSMKENVKAAVAHQVGGRAGGLAGTLSGFAAGSVVSPVVDAAVTPAGIAALMRGTAPGRRGHGKKNGNEHHTLPANLEIDRGYAGPNRFEVRYRDRDSGAERLALILPRDGLGWKLAAVRLPGTGAGE